MVSRDHNPFGSTAAFFKESMRRDAMTGTRIVFALWDTSRRQYQSLEGHFDVKEKENLHPWQESDFLLNIRAQ